MRNGKVLSPSALICFCVDCVDKKCVLVRVVEAANLYPTNFELSSVLYCSDHSLGLESTVNLVFFYGYVDNCAVLGVDEHEAHFRAGNGCRARLELLSKFYAGDSNQT